MLSYIAVPQTSATCYRKNIDFGLKTTMWQYNKSEYKYSTMEEKTALRLRLTYDIAIVLIALLTSK